MSYSSSTFNQDLVLFDNSLSGIFEQYLSDVRPKTSINYCSTNLYKNLRSNVELKINNLMGVMCVL